MFTAFAAGLFLIVTGALGFNIKAMRGVFQGGRWQDEPVWWQIALGSGLVALGVYWFRRLRGGNWTFVVAPRDRRLKNVGHGKSAGAEGTEER